MKIRRVLVIGIAVLLAGLGTVGVLVYVKQADNRAIAGQKAVTVLVAEQRIPSGTSASSAQREGLLHSETLPAASVPSDAVATLTPDLTPLVASADIQAGQLLLRSMLVQPSQATSGLAIPDGMVAVTIQLCMAEAVAGNIHAGSQVALFDTLATGNALGNGSDLSAGPNCDGPHKQQVGDAANTRVVLAKAQVLSVGPVGNAQNSSQANNAAFGQSAGPSTQVEVLVTLALNQNDAERAILVTEAGLPYLALLTDASHTAIDTTLTPLFPPVK